MASNDADGILLNLTFQTIEESDSRLKHKKTKYNQQSNLARKPRNVTKSVKSIQTNSATEKDANESVEKFQVISSLFQKNPPLPDISSEICQPENCNEKTDDTFSGSEFRNTCLAPLMVSNLEKNLHLKKMTSVQKASLPSLLCGTDMFINSPTGTGKTLSYIIPVVQSLQAILPKIQRKDGIYCLVIVPTRELANQTLAVIQQVLKPFIWIVPGCVTGGERRKSEKARLRKGINILVATPGRLVDHIKTTQCLTVSQLRWIILDEADRLLDLGFEQDISFIFSTIKDSTLRKVQKVLLSATLSQDVENLLDVNFDNPVTINMTHDKSSKLQEYQYQTPNLLEQFCVVVPMKLRLVTLAIFLEQKYQENCKIIVFLMTQDSVDFHFMLYSKTLRTAKGNKLKLMKFHGNLSQNERSNVYSNFKALNKGILLCTDVAARGLDLPSVTWIVQYNPPASSTDYVHRVGRTARIGMSGKALLFLLPTEVSFLTILKEQNLRVNEIKINEIFTNFAQSLQTSKLLSEERLHNMITEKHMELEESVCKNEDLKNLASAAFRSFIGAYNTFPTTVKHIFHSRNLHLGHLAKSFALREAPNELKQKHSKASKERRLQIIAKRKPRKHASDTPEPLMKKIRKR